MKMFDSPSMREVLKRFIRSQMTLNDLRYQDLQDRLAQLGVKQDINTLRTKINQGGFGAQLFVYILMALEIDNLNVNDLRKLLDSIEKNN